MKAITLPDSIRQFVKEQVTIEIAPDDPVFPYSEYWWKAVVFLLLSGRIKSTYTRDLPNLTDVNRVCKEANFNQYYFQTYAEFFIACEVVSATRDGRYVPGNLFEEFWCRNLPRIKTATHHGLSSLIGRFISPKESRPKPICGGVVAFLQMFFRVFAGKSLRTDMIGQAFRAFSMLPAKARVALGQDAGIGGEALDNDCQPWLDAAGQAALIRALYVCGWAYQVTQDGQKWFSLNHTGLVMLGLDEPPQYPKESTDLKVLANFSVLAGIDLAPQILITLFRYCKIKAIGQIVKFRLDEKTMTEVASITPAVEELSRVLEGCAPLPAKVANFLNRETIQGGELHLLLCGGLVRVDDPRVLDHIKAHPKLKGYLVNGGPPGYLVIKEGVRLINFVQRCKDYGFEVKMLEL